MAHTFIFGIVLFFLLFTVLVTVSKLVALTRLVQLCWKRGTVKGYWGVAFQSMGRGRLSVLVTLLAAVAAWTVLVPSMAVARRVTG